MSFKKNRSGVPYLKNEMPRVLLSGETDATTLQEKKRMHASISGGCGRRDGQTS
jgi:hypothetical protein